MSKKKSMGLRKFQWFKMNKSIFDNRIQYTNLKKSKELANCSIRYNYKIQKSLNHLFTFHHTNSDINEEKLQYKNYLFNLLENESKLCDGNDFLFKVDRFIDDKVDASLRDEAVKHLQIMNKVYFELPFEILCSSIQLIDRFITRVKVRPKYMFCASAVCYQMIVKQYDPYLMDSAIMRDLPIISRSGGTYNDLTRMEDIIRTKLSQLHTITVYDFVDSILNYLLINHEYSLAIIRLLQPIIETAITNYRSAHQKPSILALASIMVYNSWYPHQPICSPWSLIHLSHLFKVELSVVYNYANIITELHNDRFNLLDLRKNSITGLYHRRSVSLSKSANCKLDTIVEE